MPGVMHFSSASGPKRTWAGALHMSAFGGKVDIRLTPQNVRLRRGKHRQYPIYCGLLPWRENEDLPRIEHRREAPEAGDMQRRGESGQAANGQRQNRPKARESRIAYASADHSPEQFEQLKRERDEALERETATSDILRIISNSPTNLQSALEPLLKAPHDYSMWPAPRFRASKVTGFD